MRQKFLEPNTLKDKYKKILYFPATVDIYRERNHILTKNYSIFFAYEKHELVVVYEINHLKLQKSRTVA